MSQVDWITSALMATRKAGLSGRDLRQVQWQIFEVAKGSPSAEPRDGHDVRCEMERIAASVGKIAGHTGRMLPHQAAKWLRDAGASSLAARMTKLKQARNALSHPDVELANDVQAFLCSHGNCDEPTSTKTEHMLMGLTGCWESVDSPTIKVVQMPSGFYASFDNLDSFTKMKVEGGEVSINGFKLMKLEHSSVRWYRAASELLGEREIYWHRKDRPAVNDEIAEPSTTADERVEEKY